MAGTHLSVTIVFFLRRLDVGGWGRQGDGIPTAVLVEKFQRDVLCLALFLFLFLLF